MPSASQSSQQSFSMSQQSQQGHPNASFNRGFPANPEGPQIYSVSTVRNHKALRPSKARFINMQIPRPRTPESMSTKWKSTTWLLCGGATTLA